MKTVFERQENMNKIKVAFFDARRYDVDSFTNVLAGSEDIEVVFLKPHLGRDTAALAAGCDVVCTFVNDVVDAETISILHDKGIKLIAQRAAGYNNFDLRAAFGSIHVVRVPAYSPHAVAEHTAALILSLNRKTHRAFFRTRDGNFALDGLLGFDLYGKTAGIIGTGKIGQCVIEILRGFGMKILAYDAFPNSEASAKLGFEYVDLKTLYLKSDVISLHCPLTPETTYLIDEESIGSMKTGVMIINTGRGKLINTRDLITGLKSGHIGSAGLDVYEEEADYFFDDHSGEPLTDDVLARLLTFSNVLVTAHQAFFTAEALHGIAETTLDNIRKYFADGSLPNEICYHCTTGSDCPRKKTGKCF